MNKFRNLIAGAGALALSGLAMAQEATNPLTATIDAVDLTGVSAKVAAAALLIIGVAMAFKSPTLGKRVVNKV